MSNNGSKPTYVEPQQPIAAVVLDEAPDEKLTEALESIRGAERLSIFFQAEDGIRDIGVTGVQTCALPICYVDRRRGPRSTARRLVPGSAPPEPRPFAASTLPGRPSPGTACAPRQRAGQDRGTA